jgi:catechol 2,3-dioxygenase-like lactoylglutathione lyase family enzyme
MRSLLEFYAGRLGLASNACQLGFTLTAGETALQFIAADGEPFYHFALLLPGNRFEAAREWAARHVELLPVPGSDEVTFEFEDWDARACYFHDPAGNIVELIAHAGIAATGESGTFAAGELVGLSELGLVGDRAAMAGGLVTRLELAVWSGSLSERDSLAFVGEQARTLILAAPGRGWLPTGRRAEPHPVEVILDGVPGAEAELEGSLYRIVQKPRARRPNPQAGP